jgi:pyrimidine-specific ribonucleoside hydrolase
MNRKVLLIGGILLAVLTIIVACSPAVPPIPLPTPAAPAPIPLIFDDDGSPDGMIALLYLLQHPHYEVVAVTIANGEAHPAVFAPQVARLLAAAGRPDIPVGAGREMPLVGDNAFPQPWREASDAFWGMDLPGEGAAAAVVPAAELIVESVNGADQPVTVFASGPLTNLAEALRLDPGLGERIGEVVVMGGSIDVPGNIGNAWPAIDNRVAEWNIWVDPVAAGEVFAAGLPLRLMPLDSTNQITWSGTDARRWAASASPEGEMAGDLLHRLLDAWGTENVNLWDLATATMVGEDRFCAEEALGVAVVIAAGPEQGRTVATEGPANARVCLEANIAQIKARANGMLAGEYQH